ncbi:methionine ABC transporter ATP-binding protein [Auritidibacter ignavus]|uniref:methionine ABC transporter ATP-binding protein n=1 Tax=Auritidibacter ignavus TaxID=678932 RepID=UPI002448A231|nr:ATP-binding cassette domain-containing protein [Auritidibacter ignavus]WGH85803.1 ATP-binding cassette domain-containing protein [Auritidibacter ignavus]WGH88090.1 ATP-binding cassette domain-containing protein [Auritidibacter ignavus]
MISLRHVTTTFKGGEITAVDNVSLEIRRGSIHGIIGFSGAGKSTLLRNINLLERPTAGQVWVDGEELTQLNAEQLRQRRHQIGMIFQGFNLVNNHTALANVEQSLTFSGVKDRRERRRRALEALDLVDLAEKARAYPAQLSGGQKQRVAIARALATQPNVLLCDEPTSALDPFTTATVLQYLADINAQLGITIVLVTYEMEVIKALADDVTVMEHGSIVEQFTTDDLRAATFQPQTAIGRYLLSEGISVQKGRSTPPDVPVVVEEAAELALQKVGE